MKQCATILLMLFSSASGVGSASVPKLVEQMRGHLVDPATQLTHSDPLIRAEAIYAFAGSDSDQGQKLAVMVRALKDPDSSVRLIGVYELAKMDAYIVLNRIFPLLDSPKREVRAAVCELLNKMGAKASRAKEKVFAMIRKYRDQIESSFYTAEVALASIGLLPADSKPLVALLRDPHLSPLRRASVIRLLGKLGPAAEGAIPDLLALISEDPLKFPLTEVMSRTGVDGDIFAAVVALGNIGPSPDSHVSDAVLKRLRQISEMDDFNVPKWMKEGASQSIASIRSRPDGFRPVVASEAKRSTDILSTINVL